MLLQNKLSVRLCVYSEWRSPRAVGSFPELIIHSFIQGLGGVCPIPGTVSTEKEGLLGVQWLRIPFATQETPVYPLVWEDPLWATKPMGHNY